MRVAALYFVAAAFVIAMSTPGPHPLVSGGAFAISMNDEPEPIRLAGRWDDSEFGRRDSLRNGFNASFSGTLSGRSDSFHALKASSHPAAQRHAEVRAMLATTPPPGRSAVEIEAELSQVRLTVDQHQGVFDGLASELEVLREELSHMDRREAATEIAERIDATQREADDVRGELVHALMGLTSTQAELRDARRYEDLQQELVALEQMMMSVKFGAEEEELGRDVRTLGAAEYRLITDRN